MTSNKTKNRSFNKTLKKFPKNKLIVKNKQKINKDIIANGRAKLRRSDPSIPS